MFSPDTGRITHLSYDTFGLPTIPEALLNVYEVDAEAVLEVRSGLVVLKRGAERAVVLVSTGLLGYALDKAKVRPHAPCVSCRSSCTLHAQHLQVLSISLAHMISSLLGQAKRKPKQG